MWWSVVVFVVVCVYGTVLYCTVLFNCRGHLIMVFLFGTRSIKPLHRHQEERESESESEWPVRGREEKRSYNRGVLLLYTVQ